MLDTDIQAAGATPAASATSSVVGHNPVLPGFHPDPSVCRVDEDYYLVNSSFQYFPGLPLHHSRDLVHWRPIGHAVDRPGQLALDGVRPSGGLYAASLTHHGGRFHLVCTLIDGHRESGNFLLSADDPTGDWSDPVWLPDAPGFDPSLFFDDDGSAYLLGTRQISQAGHTALWLRGLDLAAGRLTGPEHTLFHGALVDARWAEGPHLYRHDGFYHLLLAEGGTDHDHAVTVARSRSITGPYENNPRNPVLTHRHLGRGFPVTGVGHADLVRTPGGDWYALALASRPYDRAGRAPLGRETFLARVVWEDGWPVINPGAGRLEDTTEVALAPHPWPPDDPTDDFDDVRLHPRWNVLRTPHSPFWNLTERPGHLRLNPLPIPLAAAATPAFVGRRQQHAAFTARTLLEFRPTGPGQEAGLAVLHDQDHHITLLLSHDGGTGRELRLTVRDGGADTPVARLPVGDGPVRLAVIADGPHFTFAARPHSSGAADTVLATVDGSFLSSAHAGGFTGTYIGVHATTVEDTDAPPADFDWFQYQPESEAGPR